MQTLTDNELRERLVAECERLGSQMVCAAQFAVSSQYINDLLHGRRRFSDTMAAKMGYKRVFVRNSEDG